MPNEQKSAMRRRTIIRGAAWTVPSLAVAAAAPALAASQECTTETREFNVTGGEVTVTVPPEAQYIDYVVRGGGGGGQITGGHGATTSGRITFADSSSPRQFVVIVGAGGAVTRDGTRASGGYGYGSGGPSTPGPRVTETAPTGGGGGGSALLLAGTRTPVVVAAGGGGSAVTSTVSGSTKLVNTHRSPGLVNPQGDPYQYGTGAAGEGSGNGRAGGMGGVNATATGLATSPALAAIGASGGRGGGGSMYRVGNFGAPWDRSVGEAGGDHGSAPNGGGNGGAGAPRLSNGNVFRASAGGGGGGYAGGGGGGIVGATFGSNNVQTQSAGSGAAGSNYVMPSGSGLTVANDGFTNSGLDGTASSGHPGFVSISWCV